MGYQFDKKLQAVLELLILYSGPGSDVTLGRLNSWSRAASVSCRTLVKVRKMYCCSDWPGENMSKTWKFDTDQGDLPGKIYKKTYWSVDLLRSQVAHLVVFFKIYCFEEVKIENALHLILSYAMKALEIKYLTHLKLLCTFFGVVVVIDYKMRLIVPLSINYVH